MKRIFLFVFLLCLCFGLLSCQNNNGESESSSSEQEQSSCESSSEEDLSEESSSFESSSEESSSSESSTCEEESSSEEVSYVFDSELLPLEDDEKETVTFEDTEYVYGTIVGKSSPNALVLKLGTPKMVNEWGELAYIITDEAAEWDVGDAIQAYFTEAERPNDSTKHVRIVAERVARLLLDGKPIIYLYPESDTVCTVRLELDGTLICTYPSYEENGWENFIAHPDGTLVFPNGRAYYALYWEGLQFTEWDFSCGFCVRGEDTVEFLEWALAEQGLSAREINEFIIYWLPIMQESPYNVISFQTNAYTDGAILEIDPNPDCVIRVFMAFYASETEVDIKAQELEKAERHGFTVVEWGGSQVIKP